MKKQREIIQEGEGDKWHERNRLKSRANDPVLAEIFANDRIKFGTVLEIGCGTGWRLERIQGRHMTAECKGVDLSWEAIDQGKERFKRLGLRVGDATAVGHPDSYFDLVILGFFMYLVDRDELFKVVAEVDRALKDGGALVVHDFLPQEPHSRPYHHDERLTTYKMGYHHLFLANPSYRVEQFKVFGSGDERESIYTLRKNHAAGWPRKE